ncbi:hypothetical protein DYBT9275_04296 [Dyadobacter sp. CECT 9275]|uniref:Periplasmic heavy metal sensor n=1 Tax=Dyadobacter helix TaxID=2822344 RepID=A0A916JHU7_9BACT|nr:hypothetical protein [Dyadobacter sp. CECT 9275]CAG5008537.1 hypothetical protein DYBT9275_04296 [Dyadobacter sp. CECT 9275]
MSKIRLLGIAVGFLLVLNLVILFLLVNEKGRVPFPGMPEHDREHPKRIIIEQLDFDKDQVMQYEKLIQEHRRAVTELEGQIRETKKNLYLTLRDQKQTGRDSLENRLGDLQKLMEAVHYNHFAAIRNLCKPAQLQHFDVLTRELAFFFVPGKK